MSLSTTILAVDGGNSKTDIALVAQDGAVLGTARVEAGSYHAVGMEKMVDNIRSGIGQAAAVAGSGADTTIPVVGVYCLAGADLPVDDQRLQRALGEAKFARETIVRNDAFAGLRAGCSNGWGISLVCGAGMNCAGVAPSGEIVRFPALGVLSGDEGGGGDLAIRALAAAIRAQDGRAPRSSLERVLPEHFGLHSPIDLLTAVHTDELAHSALVDLAPVVFSAAQAGDEVARGLVSWLADELILMGGSAIRRLGLSDGEFEIVFVGSIWKTTDQVFHDRVCAGLREIGPQVVFRYLDAPPVLGAALLGADHLGLGATAQARMRQELTAVCS